jgi:hypothetical protein
MIPRILNLQGILGVAAALALLGMLVFQKAETRHWRKQSGQFESLYRDEQSASARTVANYRAAAEAASAADLAAARRVRSEQTTINDRIANDLQIRLAAARDRAVRLRIEAGSAPADSGGRAGPPMPSLPTSGRQFAQAAGEDRLPDSDKLTATEQALQLDELVRWVKAQADVDPNRSSTRADQP